MKNNIIIKFLLVVIVVFIASIYLPQIYWKTFPYRYSLPRVYYSPILEDLLILKQINGRGRIKDINGKSYSLKEFESLVPQSNYSQLVYDGLLPDSVNGVEFDVPELRKNFFRVAIKPIKIFSFDLLLYPLIESAPDRPNLVYPDEFFTVKDRMRVINASSNQENEVFSTIFTAALKDNDFIFPPKRIFGNPTTRKPFDEGYFIVDNKDDLYHLKRVKDMPYCRKIELPVGTKIVYADVVEKTLQEFYGFFITEKNELLLISYDEYKVINIPIKNYSYQSSNLNIVGDILYRTISVTNDNKVSFFIFNRQYDLVENYQDSVIHQNESTQGIIAAYLFPFTLSLSSEKSQFINFYFESNGYDFILFNIALSILFIIFLFIRKTKIKDNYLFIVLLILTGIYGIVPIFLIRNFNQSNSGGV